LMSEFPSYCLAFSMLKPLKAPLFHGSVSAWKAQH
jgi:hypothetical protein